MPSWAPLAPEAFSVLGPALLGYSPSLSARLRQSDAEIVHTHGIWQFPSAAVLAWHNKTSKPYLVSSHGMLDQWAVKNSNLKKRVALALYERQHLQKAACIRALCEAEAKTIRDFGLRNPISIIPNGIDLPEQTNSSLGPQPLPWEGLIEKDRNVLLYLGRLHPKKGLVNLLKAWKLQIDLHASTANRWILAIAGWDQNGHELQLKQLATQLQISWTDLRTCKATSPIATATRPPKLLFLGPKFGEDKAACYSSCNAFILPSLSEGLPMAVLEAWAHAKPVLMTPQCNLPEGFSADAALCIEADVQGICQGLRCLLPAPDAAVRSMGARGRNLVSKRFAWPSIAKDLKEVYEWILGSGPTPGYIHQ